MSEAYILDTDKELERLEAKFEKESTLEQLNTLGFKNGMRFLDAGSAGGATTRLVASIAPESKVFGIDKNENYLHYARGLAQDEGLTTITYQQSDIASIPFKDDSFDFVWCRFLFEYLRMPLEALKELRRVVRPGGIVAIGDLDGNCIFHYPMEKTFENRLMKILALLENYGFDPFVGRKLFHYFLKTGFNKAETHLFPYHNIAGKPNERHSYNWRTKISNVISFLRAKSAINHKFLSQFEKEVIEYIHDEKTFTYSVLIFAKGRK